MADCFYHGRKSPKGTSSDQLPSYYGLNNKHGLIVVSYGDYHKSIVAKESGNTRNIRRLFFYSSVDFLLTDDFLYDTIKSTIKSI